MKYLRLFPLLAAVLLMAACSNHHPIEGSWQLQQFAYGTDTMSMDEFDIDQVWVLTAEQATADSLAGYNLGTQRQDEVMDRSIAWKVCDDTLYTIDIVGFHRDTFAIKQVTKEGMVLVSTINDIPVTQIFTLVE